MPDTVLNKNNAAAFIAGALLGAGVALLLAPQSGRKTRRDLCHFAEKTRNKVEAAQIELRRSIDNIVGDTAERIEEGLNRGIDWTDSEIAELQRALDAGRKFIQGEIEKIQSSWAPAPHGSLAKWRGGSLFAIKPRLFPDSA